MIANETTPQETKMTKQLTTIGHRTAFNNEQSPYCIVSYKRLYTFLFLLIQTWVTVNSEINARFLLL